MRVAMLTPLPPTKSGIAHYASMLLPALQKRLDVQPFDSLERYKRDAYDAVFYQLGNNPHHEFVYREAMARPGVVVLHDMVLHHLVVEMTLARGDVEGYAAALRASHGAVGEAWARGRAAGLHSEMGNFLLPASIELANRSRSVIVHNRYAAGRLLSLGVRVPIHVVAHPHEPTAQSSPAEIEEARHQIRRNHGIAPRARVIGFFGFLTSAKRAEVVLEAFRRARARQEDLVLLIVGEPAPNIDLAALRGPGIVTTGYVADDDFTRYYQAVDRLVNLRYPTAGESSGTLIRAFDAGKPVAVSDYAQFAEFTDTCVTKIPLGDHEVDQLANFFTDDLDETSIAMAQRRWLEENATLSHAVDGYLAALEHRQGESAAVSRSLPLFPSLSLVSSRIEARQVTLRVRNGGDVMLRARSYDEPAYRIIAKHFHGPREMSSEWMSLPCDLPVATETDLALRRGEGTTLRLYHALQDVPALEPELFATVELNG